MTYYIALKDLLAITELRAFLVARLGGVDDVEPLARHCDGTHRHTRAWARANGRAPDGVVDLVKQCGGYCDCEVVFNACDTEEEVA